MTTERYFLLPEAADMAPFIRRLLVDIRTSRARLSLSDRLLERVDLAPSRRATEEAELRDCRRRLGESVAEAARLGVVITPGIRCEALFPFRHRWTGPHGDGAIRDAYFVFNDAEPSVYRWYFAGWPSDRREVWPHWWHATRVS